ncbi:peptidoglycan-binding domain-containing protein [Kitasatospora terrestris]|uniref:Peptidoglycan binding-like domain-containing protein n=1 Tax=Kitasatospora terrestris TaxID=258051 RepID=A0ABP9DHU2_9ACTN
MPAELCPRCGAARTAGGCGCFSDPSNADTAVLPHVEGPPLVRPYVAAAPVEQPGPGPDPFATRLAPPTGLPPMPPAPPAPPVAPYPGAGAAAQTTVLPGPVTPGPVTPGAVPLGPVAPAAPAAAPAAVPVAPAAAQTAVLPPVPAQPPAQPPVGQPGPEAHTQLIPPQAHPAPPTPPASAPASPPRPARSSEPATDLGMFTFREEYVPPPGSRAERRVEQQQAAGRRRTVIAGAMIGLAAVGAGLALALSPASPDRGNQALPAPTDSGIPYPGPTTPTVEASSGSPSPVAPSTTKAKPPTTRAAAPQTTAAPPSPSPSASAKPSRSASPSPSATVRDLHRGDTGADVAAMQSRLVNAVPWRFDEEDVNGTFDKNTEQALRNFQTMMAIHGEDGWYGPQTRTRLSYYPA